MQPQAPSVILLVDADVERLAEASYHLNQCLPARTVIRTSLSAEAAIDSVRSLQPECVVIDAELAFENEGRFFVRLRQLQSAVVPVIAMTGDDMQVSARTAIRGGVREILDRADVASGRLCAAVAALLHENGLQQRLIRAESRESDISGRLERLSARTNFLVSTSQRFAQTLNYRDVIHLVPTLALPTLGDVCIIDLVREGILYRHSVTTSFDHAGPELLKIAPSIDASVGVPSALRTLRLAVYEEAALPAVARDDADIAELRRAGLKRIVVVPLIARDQLFGTVTFGSLTDAGDGSMTAVYEQYARFCAVALSNAQIVEEAQAAKLESEGARRRLAFQTRVSSLLSRSFDADQSLEKLCRHFTLALCDSAEIFLVDDDGALRVAARAAKSPAVLETLTHLRKQFPFLPDDAVGPSAAVRSKHSTLHVDDVVSATRRHVTSPEQAMLYAEWGVTASTFVPFAIDDRVVGVIAAYRDRSGLTLTYDDVALIEDVGSRLASYLQNVWAYERAHAIATGLQQNLLPKGMPDIPNVRIAARYIAGTADVDVGGDWYDVIEISPRRFAISIGDVIGRGIIAAATMGQLRTLLRAHAFEDASPAVSLERVNTLMLRTGDEHYATAALLVYDLDAGTITCARAGHPPPILIGPDGVAARLVQQVGLPLGAWPGATYEEVVVPFVEGSTLLLYTDGLVETHERDVDTGITALVERLQNAETEPERLADSLLAEFAPSASDDTAILILRSMHGDEYYRRRWWTTELTAEIASRFRCAAAEFLRHLAVPGEDLFEASLAIGELLGNVARHAPGEAYIEVDWRGERPHVEVGDRGPGLELANAMEIDRDLLKESGRGLSLIWRHVHALDAMSRVGGGSVINIVLDLRAAPRARIAEPVS